MIKYIYMKYLINFQVEISLKSGQKNKKRSTFTVLESDIGIIAEDDFDLVKTWFLNYFHKTSLDNFIDIIEIDQEYETNIKIGRITNSINGNYKTY